MDNKTRELIAIGASIAAHCQPCLAYHLAKAREMGLGEPEIQEAVAVGQMVEKGSMSAMRDFTQKSLNAPAQNQQNDSSCCVGKSSPAKKNRCS